MPALVNRSVGSCAGTRGDDRTTVWPRWRKYSRNRARISLPVIGAILYAAVVLLGGRQVSRAVGEQRADRPAHRRRGIAPAQQIVGQAGRGARPPRERGQPAAGGFEGAVGLAHLLERGRDGGLGHLARNALGGQLLAEAAAAHPAAPRAGLGPPAGERLIVDVAAGGEIGHHRLGDLERRAPAAETPGELAPAPGLAGQKIEGRRSGGLLIEIRGRARLPGTAGPAPRHGAD